MPFLLGLLGIAAACFLAFMVFKLAFFSPSKNQEKDGPISLEGIESEELIRRHEAIQEELRRRSEANELAIKETSHYQQRIRKILLVNELGEEDEHEQIRN